MTAMRTLRVINWFAFLLFAVLAVDRARVGDSPMMVWNLGFCFWFLREAIFK